MNETKSGMRFHAIMDLIHKIGEINNEISKVMEDAAGRGDDIARVYGGLSAEEYTKSLQTQADTIREKINKVIKNLTEETEFTKEQYDAIQKELAAASPKTDTEI